jgi:hypothetical protein
MVAVEYIHAGMHRAASYRHTAVMRGRGLLPGLAAPQIPQVPARAGAGRPGRCGPARPAGPARADSPAQLSAPAQSESTPARPVSVVPPPPETKPRRKLSASVSLFLSVQPCAAGRREATARKKSEGRGQTRSLGLFSLTHSCSTAELPGSARSRRGLGAEKIVVACPPVTGRAGSRSATWRAEKVSARPPPGDPIKLSPTARRRPAALLGSAALPPAPGSDSTAGRDPHASRIRHP